jgi:hypothetical protein
MRIVAGSTAYLGQMFSARLRKIIGSDTLDHLSGNEGPSTVGFRVELIDQSYSYIIIFEHPSEGMHDGRSMITYHRVPINRFLTCVRVLPHNEDQW